MLVGQEADPNQWFTAPGQALAASNRPTPSPSDLEPLALADRAVTRRILTSAGFAGIGFTAMDEPVYYGENCDAALDVKLG
jgi:hypothetical protein